MKTNSCESTRRWSRRAAAYCVAAFTFAAALPALAQTRDYALPGGQDYYAPRVTQDEIRTLANVELYHLGPGQEKMAKGRYLQALQDFEFILGYYPNHPKVLGYLVQMCLKSAAQCPTAESWLQKAIDRNPRAPATFMLQGLYLHRTKKVKDAVSAYNRVIELAPDSVDAHYNIGLAYVELKQYELANQHAQKNYQLGAYLPGLRNMLQKAGKWDTNASLPASDPQRSLDTAAKAEKKD